jgi:DNA topoisomerase I
MPPRSLTFQMTSVERLRTTGILRLGTPQRGFRYRTADRRRINADDLRRIKNLKIPPAWKDVAINSAAGGRLQAVGRDEAGRWQYLYHQSHLRIQELRKFKRLIQFAQALPSMRKAVAQHLRGQGLGRERVLASIVRILSISYMRPGSQVYARENGSYGIATLRPGHVSVKGKLVIFDFPGKAQVRQHREIRDAKVARIVSELLKHPGREVFKYADSEGSLVNVQGRHINEYIKEVMGQKFSAKDFRTWAGTLTCACALARLGVSPNGNKRDVKGWVASAINETAELLGNTPAVCRKSYICPEIISSFEKGKVIKHYFETPEDLISYRGHQLHAAERALVGLLK